MWGNQYSSRKGELLARLKAARAALASAKQAREFGAPGSAAFGLACATAHLATFWSLYREAPLSSRRRWKCGR